MPKQPHLLPSPTYNRLPQDLFNPILRKLLFSCKVAYSRAVFVFFTDGIVASLATQTVEGVDVDILRAEGLAEKEGYFCFVAGELFIHCGNDVGQE